VPFLGEPAVEEYLARRFVDHRLPNAVAKMLHHRTSGNALFMIGVVGGWLDRGLLRIADTHCELHASLDKLAACVPDSFVRMLERELELASALQRRVLEAASVAGREFSTAVVAAALDEQPTEVEEICLSWARRGQFLRKKGRCEWSDGTVGELFEFIHVLYQELTYERIGVARPAFLHLRIGERLEGGHGADPARVATELALHFQPGRPYGRAPHHIGPAGERALRHGDYREALDHLTRALVLIERAAGTTASQVRELNFRLMMAAALRMTKCCFSRYSTGSFSNSVVMAS
jgi:predicted ATPase